MNTEKRITSLDHLKMITNGDMEKIKTYVAIYLENVQSSLHRIDSLMASENWHDLKSLIHSLKANFEYMGMTQTRTLAQILEGKLASLDVSGIQTEMGDLKQAIRQSITELQSL